MKTTYYTLTARKVMVDGNAVRKDNGDYVRQLVCVRKADCPSGKGKVIELADWRARAEEPAEAPKSAQAASAHTRSALSFFTMENFACMAVIGTMAALILRLLIF